MSRKPALPSDIWNRTSDNFNGRWVRWESPSTSRRAPRWTSPGQTALYRAQTITLFGEPIQWVNTTRYLGATLDKRLTCSPHID
jgi:hypothetical protein